MSARLKIKRGTTTSWADSANKDTTLEPGQLGVEYLTDGNMRLKVGKQTDNGSATDWSLLPYVTPLTSVYQDDHIELYSGYKTLSVNTEGDVTNPGTYGTIHLGDPSGPYHNIRLNGDSEVVLSAPTTIVQGALSVIPATGVELKVSGGDSNILRMYPTATTSYLGTESSVWSNLYATKTNTDHIVHTDGPGSSYNIIVYDNLIPSDSSTSTTTGFTLGDSSHKWRYLYSFSGSIQTSDRSAKDSIHYIQYVEDSEAMKPATMSMRSAAVENTSEGTTSQITLEDVIDFVSNLNPVTFCYKDGQGEDVEATEENSDPEDIQLGLIADDIKDHKLFKYVGVETTYEEEVTPAVKDEEGNVVTEAVTETKTTLGLQAIPLATAALTACKYLIQKNEEIESRLSAIEEQLAALLSTDGN